MQLEQIGEHTTYSFTWMEQLIANAALKHIDRERRAGVSDSLPIHSALRAIFVDDAPKDEREEPVRWILDEDEFLGHSPDEACTAPSPQVLKEVMDHVSSEIACGNPRALSQPIGRLTLSQPVGTCVSQRAYREETLGQLSTQFKLFGQIIGRYF